MVEPDQVERRRDSGWTLWKEILGTAIAVITIMTPICLAVIAWGAHIESNLAVASQRLTTLEMQRTEISNKLDKINDTVELVARQVAGLTRSDTRIR